MGSSRTAARSHRRCGAVSARFPCGAPFKPRRRCLTGATAGYEWHMADGTRNASAHGWDAIVDALRSRPPRVTVIGDVMLDRWLRGGVRRLSRESPVPVVDLAAREDRPGGAANTAMNLAALGAEVRLLTIAGGDEDGLLLRRLLEGAGV